MSTGQATARAHHTYNEIARQIFDGPDEWLSTMAWFARMDFSRFDRWTARTVNPSKVGIVLRILTDEGHLERRRNPDDGRSTQFRVVR